MAAISIRTLARIGGIALLCLLAASPAAGQSLRDAVSGARLAPGYALILNITAATDLSAARYDVTSSGNKLSIDVLRLPYEHKWLALSDNADLYWKAVAGYLTMKDTLPVNIPSQGPGSIHSTWSAYSLSGGVFARIRLGGGFTFVPALDVAVAQLENDSDYLGPAARLQPVFDNLLFNWKTRAQLVTPGAGLEWVHGEADRRTRITGHAAWSWISSFDSSDPVLDFRETAGAFSVRAEQGVPTSFKVVDRPLGVVVYGGYAGFLGPNRSALGFSSVAEAGVGVELPVFTGVAASERLRLGASYLFGPHVRGWTVSLGMKF